MYERLRRLRNYGSVVKYHNDIVGLNSRLDEMQAAVLSFKLSHIDDLIAHRRLVSRRYMQGIINSKIILPESYDEHSHVWHLFVVQVESRELFIDFCKARGVETGIHYPIPPHLSDAYKDKLFVYSDYTELLSNRVVSLPLFDWMKFEDVDYVIEVVNSF